MSKSIGNIIDPVKLLKQFSRDQIRLYMLAEGPQDCDIQFDLNMVK